MPSLARQRAQDGASARPKVPGLKRPCLESGRAWASATRAEEARAILAMSRRGGRSKVYRELLRQCRDGVLPADLRAVSSIGARLGITERQVRKHLAALEAEKWIVKVHHAGLRLPGQRGWTTTVTVLPSLLSSVPLLPPAARDKARKVLLGERVRTALMTAGYAHQLRQAVGAVAPMPVVPPRPSPPTSIDNLSISTPMGLGSDFVSVTVSSTVSEISNASPYPLRSLSDVDNSAEEHAVRAYARTCSEPPPTLGLEGRAPDSPANAPVRPSSNARERGCPSVPSIVKLTRSEVSGLTSTQVTNLIESRGVPRVVAIQRAVGFSRVASVRRRLRQMKEPEGRKPRGRAILRATAQELTRLRKEMATQGFELEPSPRQEWIRDNLDHIEPSLLPEPM